MPDSITGNLISYIFSSIFHILTRSPSTSVTEFWSLTRYYKYAVSFRETTRFSPHLPSQQALCNPLLNPKIQKKQHYQQGLSRRPRAMRQEMNIKNLHFPRAERKLGWRYWARKLILALHRSLVSHPCHLALQGACPVLHIRVSVPIVALCVDTANSSLADIQTPLGCIKTSMSENI